MPTAFTKHAGIELPIICGAMYPCSNPELVAAVSEAGGIGIVQPISLCYVHGNDLRQGLRKIQSLTKKPVGFNAILEKSSKRYADRMRKWVDCALEEGIRFFITALGNPEWVVKKVHSAGGVVYHDATDSRWARKAIDHEVDGLICVNNRAGGHDGAWDADRLYRELSKFGVPLIAAGGVGSEDDFRRILEQGYAGVQMGTRFIATEECNSHMDYKKAIVNASADGITVTERISGIPLSVIRTAGMERTGTKTGPLAKRLLKWNRTKGWMRMLYYVRSTGKMKNATLKGGDYSDYFVAGKSVDGIHSIEPAGEIVRRFARAINLTE